ncbi:carboxy terminal-processing peptidase, partial [Vibrio parahaemolyticus]|nr:carboxy terminal-processing peptidase [Vibrio parahaemolyticus]
DLFDKELGYVQYTIQKFYRIDGGSTQNRGVAPDISYPTPIEASETGESVEDNALPWDQIDKAQYQTFPSNDALVEKLTALHNKRISDEMEFRFINEDIEKYRKEKDDNTLSLNEKVRKAESDKAEALRLQRINERQVALGKKAFKTLDDIPTDYEAPDVYLDESVAIMVDLLKQENQS